MKEKQKTFEELASDPEGTIYHDEIREGVRLLILRGPVSVNAYLGVPLDHPLAGFHYNDIPLDVHGGLTFSSKGATRKTTTWPASWWWYGWDYGHAGDKSFYDLKYRSFALRDDKAWTVEEILHDMEWGGRYNFILLSRLAEKIWAKKSEGIKSDLGLQDEADDLYAEHMKEAIE